MSEPRTGLEVALLIIHVLGAIMFIGPAAVANSVFPQYLRGRLVGADKTRDAFEPDLNVMTALHRISFRFGRNALIVPIAGTGLAILRDRFDEAWLWAAIGATVLAAGLLVATVKEQRNALTFVRTPSDEQDRDSRREVIAGLAHRAGSRAGQFNLVWVVILVLMVWRPGSPG